MFVDNPSCKSRHLTSGLIAGTMVESAKGWIRVEDLRIGDAVQSYDGGLARVVGLDRDWIASKAGLDVVHVPGGAFDNCSDLQLLSGQNLLVDTWGDEGFPDDLVVLIPALALQGMFGTTRVRIEKAVEVITPRFAEDEAIFANSGILLHCPSIRRHVGQPASTFFNQLDLGHATAFLVSQHGAFSVRSTRIAA